MRPLLARMGASYLPLTAIVRFPFAMTIVGVLTLAVAARGSMQLAGITSAAVGLGIACFGPLLGAAADRFGQRPTLLLLGALNSVALAAMAWVAYSSLPDWAMFACSFLIGATVPQTSPLSRTRFLAAIDSALPVVQRPRAIQAVLAFESATDEVVFVFGPVVVGVLATAFGGWAPVVGASILTLCFVTAFALHRTSTLPRSAAHRAKALGPASELWAPLVLITVFGGLATGLFFGSMLTSLTAFMQDRGVAEQAGLLYGLMGVGSAVLAISVAWLSPRISLRVRWLAFAAIIGLGTALLQTVHDLTGMAWTLGFLGLGIGPLLVTLYGFAATRTPEGRSATVMSMMGTGIMVGQSISTATTGVIADNLGTSLALLMPFVAACLAMGTGVVNFFMTPPRPERLRSRRNRSGAVGE